MSREDNSLLKEPTPTIRNKAQSQRENNKALTNKFKKIETSKMIYYLIFLKNYKNYDNSYCFKNNY